MKASSSSYGGESALYLKIQGVDVYVLRPGWRNQKKKILDRLFTKVTQMKVFVRKFEIAFLLFWVDLLSKPDMLFIPRNIR